MTATNEEMVRKQLAGRGIRDARVLEAFRAVDRAEFVPEHFAAERYEDKPLPLADLATISQPYIVAVMTGMLRVHPEHRALEVGTGSGYQAAILSRLAGEVWSVELLPELLAYAQARLTPDRYPNVRLRLGNGWEGLPGQAPFDRILVAAAGAEIPEPLLDQLGRCGRLVMPVGETGEGRLQNLHLVTRDEDGELHRKVLTPVQFVPLRDRP